MLLFHAGHSWASPLRRGFEMNAALYALAIIGGLAIVGGLVGIGIMVYFAAIEARDERNYWGEQ